MKNIKNLKIKIITGFRKDQHYSIEAEEAHKAFALFLNPQSRAIFKNGLALVGQNIQGIEPDYQASMGWNPDHILDADDWREIRSKGVDYELREILSVAKDVAINMPDKLNLPLSEIKLLE